MKIRTKRLSYEEVIALPAPAHRPPRRPNPLLRALVRSVSAPELKKVRFSYTKKRMEELGLVDDEKFARRYAEELIYTKHLSVRGARYKLTEKGIDKELADEILEELDPDPREHIQIIIERKYKNALSDEKGKRRCIAALQRMGYSWSDINAVIGEYFEDEYI